MFLITLVLMAMAETGAGEAVAVDRTPNCPEPVVGNVVNPEFANVTPEVEPPTVTSRLEPLYPPDVNKALKVKAKVLLQGTIDVDGNVGDVTTVSCSVTKQGAKVEGEEKTTYCAAFTAAARTSFSNWLYEPAVKNGKKVCVYETAAFAFGRPK